MERKTTISIFLGLLAAGALIWGGHEYHQVQVKNIEISQIKRQKATLLKTNAKLKGTVIAAKQDQEAAVKTQRQVQNNSADNKAEQTSNATMTANITTVFNGLYNYNQDTYQQRQAKVKRWLSPKLNQQYFGGKSQLYGDGSQVTSKLTQLRVYRQAVSGPQLKALVVTKYKSKYASAKTWNSGTSVYEVTYDSAKQQVTAIDSLISKVE
ncbi:hypothetical protein C1940_17195 (plasmid) [Lactiplantibacillus plantarum subsp. plantarum]|uniref:hypothetical protein n=1 Tax=Lactiplantibacillus plantarum TaxID=1590 RepID=UPI000CD32F5D|nr:hypothetical protein [Lactiplantibacillus plantarum]AUV74187.1 hypothetical protein C1940_17195 [Lactiplantibacillus plantarum subsp. plantarum]MYU99219.1 hypothetical protein [Lactiplantibacillus plantarum]